MFEFLKTMDDKITKDENLSLFEYLDSDKNGFVPI